MINRELIRIKVVQLVYAYYLNGEKTLDIAEKELLTSLSKAYQLYNLLLDLIVAVTNEERLRYEMQSLRAQREGIDFVIPKFAYNRFAVQLEENEQLSEYKEDKKLSWKDDIEFVRKVCNLIEQSETYKEYILSDVDSYDADREVWRKLYKQIIEDNDDLALLLEDKSIYWNDDKEIVDSFVVKTIKRFDPANKSHQELLPEFKDEIDREYAIKLFRSSILNADEYRRYMEQYARNWKLNRMPLMDIVIMQIALAELFVFPAIPASVTINEYVELAKAYSTPRSASFVNGILDALTRALIEKGKLIKQL
jgi:N utilization substance protein B